MLTIYQRDYVLINGLIFQNNFVQYAKGIFVNSQGSHITITNCTVRNIGWTSDPTADPYGVSPTGQAHGILVNGRTTDGIHDIKITDCVVHDVITGNSEALTLVGNVYNFEISSDSVFNTTNIGIAVAGHYSYAIDVGVDSTLNQSRNGEISHCVTHNNRRINNVDAPAGIYADGAAQVLIYNNVSYQNGNGISVGCENAGFSADSIIVMNNLIYNNDNQGIIFGSNSAIISSCTLKNNTFLHNGSLGNFYSEVALQNSDNSLIIQNILLPRSISHYAVSIFGYTATNLVVDNNLAYRYDGNTVNLYVPGSPAQFVETNSTNADPLLVDTMIFNPNVRLQATSPAINAGFSAYGALTQKDLYHGTRLVNGAIDLGASENEDGGCPQFLTVDTSMTLAGDFFASDSIYVDVQGNSMSDSVQLFAPNIDVLPVFETNNVLFIKPGGC